MRRLHTILAALLPLLLTTCAHRIPGPPTGMARLILDCCWIPDAPARSPLPESAAEPVCKQRLPSARVRLDGVEAGVCMDWARSGKLVQPGGHRIDVEATSSMGNECESGCEGGTSAYVILREGEVQTKFIGFALQRYDPPG
jgi:hypothetical protein